MTSPEATCIYCNQSRLFTDEHMFPAGLGGDDRRYMLKGLVCGVCNTAVFSHLELEVARKGPEAFARLFLQPEGRGSGKKASIPSLQTEATTFIDPDVNVALEADLAAGGATTVLAQLLFSNGELSLTGPSTEAIDQLFVELEGLLQEDEIYVVRKFRQEDGSAFDVETYRWTEHRYRLQQTAIQSRPPARGIWREELRVPPRGDTDVRHAERVFRRSQGGLILRVLPEAAIADRLSTLRHALPVLAKRQPAALVSVERPTIQVGLHYLANATPRVMAKIGLNVACFEHGEQFARLPIFGPIKQAILHGEQDVPHEIFTHDHPIHSLLSIVPGTVHVTMTTASMGPTGEIMLFTAIQLYGGAVYTVKLAGNVPSELPPVFYVVDYIKHVITRYDLQSFLLAFGAGETLVR